MPPTGERRVEFIDPQLASFQVVSSVVDGLDDTKGTESDSDRFKRLKDMAVVAIEHYRPWWAEFDSLSDMYAGRQWSDEDRKALERQLRPCITFNRVGPVLDSLQGLEINNREMIKAYPRKVGNAKQSELWSSSLQWGRDMAGSEGEESDMFFDLALGGMGWTETYLKPSDRHPGVYDPGMDRVDPTEMAVDPEHKKRNCKDARFLVRVRQIPVEAAEQLFEAEPHEMHASWAMFMGDDGDPSRLPENYLFNSPANTANTRKFVTIVEIQWWEYQPYFLVQDPFTGQKVHMDKKTFDEATRRLKLVRPGVKLNSAKYRRRIYRRAFLGTKILKEPPLACPYNFTYQCATGKRDKTKRHWFGLARAMQDPQMWANKWLSQIMHVLNSNAKGGILADKNVFEDWKKVQQNWTNPKFVAWLAAGRKPEEVGYRQQAQFPQGLFELMNFAMQSVPDANGFSSELLGLADRDQPSSLEYQRRQAGMTVLAIFFHSLRQYRKAQGEIMLYMIQKWMADGRLIRVVIETGDEQYIPLLMDQDEGLIEYDLVIDEAPSSPNQKEAVWSMLVQAMPMLSTIQMPPQIMLELLAYSPLPASVIQKMREAMEDPAQAQQGQAMQQMTLALMGAQAKLFQADAVKSVASAQAQTAKAAKDNTDADAAQIENALKREAAGVAGLAVPGQSAPPAAQLPAPAGPPAPGPGQPQQAME